MLVSTSAFMHRDVDGLYLGVSALKRNLEELCSLGTKCVYLNTKIQTTHEEISSDHAASRSG